MHFRKKKLKQILSNSRMSCLDLNCNVRVVGLTHGGTEAAPVPTIMSTEKKKKNETEILRYITIYLLCVYIICTHHLFFISHNESVNEV